MPANSNGRFFPYGIQILLISHSIFWMAANLLLPFIGIFFITELKGVTLTEIGISTLIFSLAFGLLEPVMGFIADRIPGIKDEVFFLAFGYFARGIMFILLAFATNVWHLYMFEFFLGIFRAIAGPADKVLYVKYLQGRQSATLWGIDESMVNIFSALGAGLGGYMIGIYGFRMMFVVAGVITMFAGLVNLPLMRSPKKKHKFFFFGG